MSVRVLPFARNFATSRELFRDAAEQAGGACVEYVHPLSTQCDTPLVTDVVQFGDTAAERLQILVTGVHGVEHYAGSACLVDWLEGGGVRDLLDDTAVLMVHAINPWGAANFRRNTEDNVDLARNFMDFGQALPEHPAYEAIHGDLATVGEGNIPGMLAGLIDRLGENGTVDALMSGQYGHPDGFSFGGNRPCWSRRTLEAIIEGHSGKAGHVSIVEYHTGLGAWGQGTPVTMHAGADCERVRCFYGNDVIAPRIEEGHHNAPGHTTDGYVAALPGRQITSIVLEFGTYPPSRSLPVLLRDHWHSQYGIPGSAAAKAVGLENLEMHCPDDAEWQRSVLERSAQIIEMSIAGLRQCS